MKTLIVTLLSAAFIARLSPVNSQPKIDINAVGCLACDGRIQGSGFVMSHPSVVFTSYHVIESCDVIEFIAHDEKKHAMRPVYLDSIGDFAVLASTAKIYDNPFTKISSSTPMLGDSVFYVAMNMANIKMSEGGMKFDHLTGESVIVASGVLANRGGEVWFVAYSGAAGPGSSGGPIFNVNGEVFGIIAAGFDVLPVPGERERVNLGFLNLRKIEIYEERD